MKSKLLLAIALLFAVGTVLVGCGSGTETEAPADDAQNEQPPAEEADTSEDDATEEEEAEAETKGETQETEAGVFTKIKEIEVNETKETGPFTITLEKVLVQKGEFNEMGQEMFEIEAGTVLAAYFSVENTSDDTWSIYPDQSVLITDTGKQVDADVWIADDIGGEFFGKVTKTGAVPYIIEEDPDAIGNIRIRIDAPHDENFESDGETIEFEVEL